jgi:hypothetical protein
MAEKLPSVREHYGHQQWSLKPAFEGHGFSMPVVSGNNDGGSELLLPLNHGIFFIVVAVIVNILSVL